MGEYLVVGAGPVGSAVARQLLERGDSVTVVTRSGSGPDGARCVAQDAGDAEAMVSLGSSASVIFNCANPPYHAWTTDWPPIAQALLDAAQASGAVLATASNLYGYGPVSRPMTPDLPLVADYPKARVRIDMWQDALAAHEAGRIRAVEVRGADYVGAGEQSQIDRVIPAVLAGKAARVLGDPDLPHSWTYTGDMARTLVAAADDESSYGRPWHALVASDASQRQALTEVARIAGVEHPTIKPVPMWQLKLAGLVSPLARELPDVAYQLTTPFVCDDAETRSHFGLQPTAWRDVLARSVAAAQ